MEAGWRPFARTAAKPEWMEPFAHTIGAAKKYFVSSTLDRVDWNAVPGGEVRTHRLGRQARGEPVGALRACLKGWFGGTKSLHKTFFWPVSATYVAETGQIGGSRGPSGPRTPTFQTGSKFDFVHIRLRKQVCQSGVRITPWELLRHRPWPLTSKKC